MLEAGEEMAGFAAWELYGEPSPQIELRKVGRNRHLGKVLAGSGGRAPVWACGRYLLRLALLAGGRWSGMMEL